jgi:hypothetical protein
MHCLESRPFQKSVNTILTLHSCKYLQAGVSCWAGVIPNLTLAAPLWEPDSGPGMLWGTLWSGLGSRYSDGMVWRE